MIEKIHRLEQKLSLSLHAFFWNKKRGRLRERETALFEKIRWKFKN
jgi:hypothetical protein